VTAFGIGHPIRPLLRNGASLRLRSGVLRGDRQIVGDRTRLARRAVAHHPSPDRGRIFVPQLRLLLRPQPELCAEAGDDLGQRLGQEGVEVEDLAVEQAMQVDLEVGEAAGRPDARVGVNGGVNRAFGGVAAITGGLVSQAAGAFEVGDGGEALVDAVLDGGGQRHGAADLGEGSRDLVDAAAISGVRAVGEAGDLGVG
jgi:hypothetical protein